MDRRVWQATVHGVTKSWPQLSDSHSLNILNYLKGMAIKLREEERAECKG